MPESCTIFSWKSLARPSRLFTVNCPTKPVHTETDTDTECTERNDTMIHITQRQTQTQRRRQTYNLDQCVRILMHAWACAWKHWKNKRDFSHYYTWVIERASNTSLQFTADGNLITDDVLFNKITFKRTRSLFKHVKYLTTNTITFIIHFLTVYQAHILYTLCSIKTWQ